MSEDGEGFLLETIVGKSQGESGLHGRERIREEAEKICAKQKLIVERMRERGIDLAIHGEAAPEPEKIRSESKEAIKKKKRRQTAKPSAKAKRME